MGQVDQRTRRREFITLPLLLALPSIRSGSGRELSSGGGVDGRRGRRSGDLLGKVSVPTLVMHVRGDLMHPFEAGRQMAVGIPGARFVALQGQNHALLPGEPAAVRFREELELFLTK
jgi:pimeloyl-ACP methyl ester carboxylesterase